MIDVLVVGAGPAGAVAATLLARTGARQQRGGDRARRSGADDDYIIYHSSRGPTPAP